MIDFVRETGSLPPNDPYKALRKLRRVWWRHLVLQVVWSGVCTAMALQPTRNSLDDAGYYFLAAATGVAIVCIPFCLRVRAKTFRQHAENGVITPRGYYWGSWVTTSSFFAVTMMAMGMAMASHWLWPHAALAVVGFVLFLLSWPTGKPMFPPRASASA